MTCHAAHRAGVPHIAWHDTAWPCHAIASHRMPSHRIASEVDLLLDVHGCVAPAHLVHLVLQHLPLGAGQPLGEGDAKGADLHLVGDGGQLGHEHLVEAGAVGEEHVAVAPVALGDVVIQKLHLRLLLGGRQVGLDLRVPLLEQLDARAVQALEDLDAHHMVPVVQQRRRQGGLACAAANVVELAAGLLQAAVLVLDLLEGDRVALKADLAVDQRGRIEALLVALARAERLAHAHRMAHAAAVVDLLLPLDEVHVEGHARDTLCDVIQLPNLAVRIGGLGLFHVAVRHDDSGLWRRQRCDKQAASKLGLCVGHTARADQTTVGPCSQPL
mmetsp:Transcript_74948/g.207496  ORF Transcript_74948/g.207496 Transcript_74948/m.207496 type:complete len:329 (+) Transcript_74948:167-1153(+)